MYCQRHSNSLYIYMYICRFPGTACVSVIAEAFWLRYLPASLCAVLEHDWRLKLQSYLLNYMGQHSLKYWKWIYPASSFKLWNHIFQWSVPAIRVGFSNKKIDFNSPSSNHHNQIHQGTPLAKPWCFANVFPDSVKPAPFGNSSCGPHPLSL